MFKIASIVGARPNFMKVAPIHRLFKQTDAFEPFLIHTGQHYDEKMSKIFFHELKMPEPDLYLGVGSGTHAKQTAAVMIELEKVFLQETPDWIVVVGDVNSTLAASLVASKLHIPVAHVEAGLRSFDRSMPEEINRIMTDAISDLLFVTEHSGMENLKKEGISDEKIHFVGNVMIDSLVEHLEKAKASNILQELNAQPGEYALMTLHRPSNVDNRTVLRGIFDAIDQIQKKCPVYFPIHPRTKKMLIQFGLEPRIREMNNLHIIDPLGYLSFMRMMSQARLLLTDSGGIQEESTFLGIPCITLRENTERPITVDMGTNQLVGSDPTAILDAFARVWSDKTDEHQVPPLWDGHAAKRIVDVFKAISQGKRTI
ncbi:UDP-N-acetylglucosamine 2-epimerase (non-hydrolyzing) [candidate division KSB1 bacterium]|nr:UDP-N-acetylglucosamine 2-epimerase (non-hydrolyzing) [candidate division KSB1 bacterium]